jgi:hypothetical protein
MAEERDEELRELYRRLRPPPLADGAGEADPETARVVRWMQRAWRELEPPRAVLPRSVARRPRRLARPALLAAAAVVLLLAGAALWRALAARSAAVPRLDVAREPAPAGTDGVEILDVRPDRLELRSGPVRLVLLGPPPPPPEPAGS